VARKKEVVAESMEGQTVVVAADEAAGLPPEPWVGPEGVESQRRRSG
jgi:hypothetical protein